METNLVIEGFKFMGLGMGTVLLFLIILIFMINIMSKILNRFFPEVKPNVNTTTVNTQNNHKKVVAAITAAIKHHREG
jgi:oxaloacetate decarboxylase gamma subunit